jgi:two-component sensor histidine kinase
MTWRESGGPPVASPLRRGFGSQLIEKSLAAECGGRVKLDFRPDGVVCEIEASLAGDPT